MCHEGAIAVRGQALSLTDHFSLMYWGLYFSIESHVSSKGWIKFLNSIC